MYRRGEGFFCDDCGTRRPSDTLCRACNLKRYPPGWLEKELEHARKVVDDLPDWKKRQFRAQRRYEVEHLGIGTYPKEYEIEDIKEDLAELDAKRIKLQTRLKELMT